MPGIQRSQYTAYIMKNEVKNGEKVIVLKLSGAGKALISLMRGTGFMSEFPFLCKTKILR